MGLIANGWKGHICTCVHGTLVIYKHIQCSDVCCIVGGYN